MIYSYSSIKMYEQCPRKFKFSKIDRLPDSSGDAANRGKQIHTEIEEVIKGGLQLLSTDIEHLAPKIENWIKAKAISEMPFAVNAYFAPVSYDDPTAIFRGVIDLYVENGPEATIIDFKTGKHRDYKDQVTVYAAVILSCKPDIEYVKTAIEFIDLVKTDEYPVITRRDLPFLLLGLKDRMKVITKDTIHAANPSGLCKFCHYRKSNGGPCKW